MLKEKLITHKTSIAPLITFRVLFGFIMSVSILRFWINGWIDEFYIQPKFHFTYYGFEWVKVLSGDGMYWLFGAMLIAAILVMVGLFYRLSIITFFLLFTYVELIDKTTYLNHYYFISLVSFLLIFLPANKRFAFDVRLFKNQYQEHISVWMINILKFQLFVVYFYAGLAKLNPDWLLEALPLKIWLPAKTDLPIMGFLFQYPITAYILSWFGAAYDITIPFLLLNKKSRPLAFLLVIIFHVSTSILFPIGMFPYIMILSTLIFFSAGFHDTLVTSCEGLLKVKRYYSNKSSNQPYRLISLFLLAYVMFQLIFPLRFLAYPGKLFWHEQGYRFSWRVMLMEKLGSATFQVIDPQSGNRIIVQNEQYLTPFQEREMCTQPDMILQFAHFLAKEFQQKGIEKPEVTVESFVTLNGQRSSLFINPQINLADQTEGWASKRWIMSYEYK